MQNRLQIHSFTWSELKEKIAPEIGAKIAYELNTMQKNVYSAVLMYSAVILSTTKAGSQQQQVPTTVGPYCVDMLTLVNEENQSIRRKTSENTREILNYGNLGRMKYKIYTRLLGFTVVRGTYKLYVVLKTRFSGLLNGFENDPMYMPIL